MEDTQLSAQLSALAEGSTPPDSVHFLLLASASAGLDVERMLAGTAAYFDVEVAMPDHRTLFWARITPDFKPGAYPDSYIFESGTFQKLSPEGELLDKTVSCNGYFTACMVLGHTIGQVNVSSS